MINMSNYRLKINLANFYNDLRKLSYIYVDTDKIKKVSELYQRINDVFNINRPFHLFIDENIFLPLNEDIRIIDKNDIITVLPKSSNHVEAINQSASEKLQPQIKFIELEEFEKAEFKINFSSQSESTSDTDNEIKVNIPKQINTNSKQSPKCDELVDSSSPKKRRRRRRGGRGKGKKNSPEVTTKLIQVNGNSPRINNDSNNVSTPKHLKFNWQETPKTKPVNGNSTKNSCEAKPTVRSNKSADLTLLLGLKNSESPLRFVSKKMKPNPPMSPNSTNNSPKIENTEINKPVFPITNSIVSKEENVNYSEINPLDYPVHTSEFEIDDVVAFRTLKMGEDYSPTVSGYIIAKTISEDHVQNNYTFKILEGHDQMKTPNGKFSFPSDEENNDEDTSLDETKLVTLNKTHLVEPRLIYRVK